MGPDPEKPAEPAPPPNDCRWSTGATRNGQPVVVCNRDGWGFCVLNNPKRRHGPCKRFELRKAN